jgi:MATE family multidrug resistance protein
MMPAVYVGVIGVVLNLVLSWILVLGIGGWSGLGFIGAPIATSLTYISHPIMLWSYVIWAGAHKNTWFGWSKEFVASDSSRVLLVILTPDCRAVSPRMLWEFLKIGIPSAVMLIIEVVGMEIVTLMLGSFKDEIALSAHNISQSLTGFVWTISAGISNGAATKVGNLLGERNHVKCVLLYFSVRLFT